MTWEQRDNEGALFKNERKTADTHPNATGKAMIGGVMYYVDAYTKEGAKGKWQSLRFKPVVVPDVSKQEPFDDIPPF